MYFPPEGPKRAEKLASLKEVLKPRHAIPPGMVKTPPSGSLELKEIRELLKYKLFTVVYECLIYVIMPNFAPGAP